MKGKALLCLALVISMLLGVLMIGQVGAQPTTIGVEPQGTTDLTLGAGSTFTVEVWIRNIANLKGVDFKIGYDTTVLTATNIAYGGIFGGTYFPLSSVINDTEGWLWHAFMEALGEPAFDGSGRASIITFSVDALGASDLGLYEVVLGDGSLPPQPISHTAIDGYFSNVHLWLHSDTGLIDLSNPVGTDWTELLPTFSNPYEITGWPNDYDSSGTLSIGDNILLKNKTTTTVATYGVDEVTVTLNASWSEAKTTINSPSSTAVVVAGWATPAEAYSSNDYYAETKTENAEQTYGTYGFSIPGGSTVTKVEVGFEAYFAGNEYMEITCSWDGGTNWATGQSSGTTPGSDDNTTRWLDFTGATSWTIDKLSNANFISKIKYIFVSGGKSYIYLDWLPVRVSYTEYHPTYIDFEGATSQKSPSSTSSVVAGWTNPTYAYSSDNSYASTSTQSATQQYGTYGFSLPAGFTITRVQVGYEAYNVGDDTIGISCSWDGGTSWAAEYVVASLPTSDPNAVTWVDFTGATSWDATKLNDANFRAKASYQYTGVQNTTYLDWLPLRVICSKTTSPSSTSVVVAGWINPANAYSSDNSYANTSTAGATQQYGGYGFSLPAGYTVTMVEVGFEAATSGDEKLNITCSWDGGTSWATEYISSTLFTPGLEPVTWVDFTAATSWTASKLSDANFRTRAKCVIVGNASLVHLDWLPLRVSCAKPNSPSFTALAGAGWTNPTWAYSSNNMYATTSTQSATQQYGGYGFSLPSAATILKVEVGYEAYNVGDDGIRISCSWDGGTSWAAEHVVGTLPSPPDPNALIWVDFTAATSWTTTKLSNANFRAKASYQYSGTQSMTYLDWIPVRVFYDLLIPDFNWANPQNTQWHEINPVFSNRYDLTSLLADNDSSGNLTVGDDIQLKNQVTGVAKSYRVNGISTDIIVTKIAHAPPVPEFPLGSVLPIALFVAVVYVWRINKRKRITKPR